ncbi:hypothetical protein L596_016830 [Steinernema carpocapsae]|uniref:Endonuclease/exonuclease/phosphatase domain-containing protein n=1 Tax=Steinernema carpocapsae TaxID=34508 RepID=A0A4U5NK81_STECR|nr:hypothetical protein L596_016830 [Steinernema carpocapsae]
MIDDVYCDTCEGHHEEGEVCPLSTFGQQLLFAGRGADERDADPTILIGGATSVKELSESKQEFYVSKIVEKVRTRKSGIIVVDAKMQSKLLTDAVKELALKPTNDKPTEDELTKDKPTKVVIVLDSSFEFYKKPSLITGDNGSVLGKRFEEPEICFDVFTTAEFEAMTAEMASSYSSSYFIYTGKTKIYNAEWVSRLMQFTWDHPGVLFLADQKIFTGNRELFTRFQLAYCSVRQSITSFTELLKTVFPTEKLNNGGKKSKELKYSAEALESLGIYVELDQLSEREPLPGYEHNIRNYLNGESHSYVQERNEEESFTFAVVNARSLRNKLIEFRRFVLLEMEYKQSEFDAVIFTETKLGNGEQFDLQGGGFTYKLIRGDRSSGQGGVTIALRDGILDPDDKTVQFDKDLQVLSVDVTYRSKVCRIIGTYIPPSLKSNKDHVIKVISKWTELLKDQPEVLMGGDYNIDYALVNHAAEGDENINQLMKKFLSDNQLVQFVNSRTDLRTGGNVKEIKDWVVGRERSAFRTKSVCSLNVLFPNFSEHYDISGEYHFNYVRIFIVLFRERGR